MARLILDTCVLIAGARGRVTVAALADTDDVAVPAVVVPAVAVAEHHAALLAHAHRTGNRRGVHDLTGAHYPHHGCSPDSASSSPR